jgi:hypothetical protein
MSLDSSLFPLFTVVNIAANISVDNRGNELVDDAPKRKCLPITREV